MMLVFDVEVICRAGSETIQVIIVLINMSIAPAPAKPTSQRIGSGRSSRKMTALIKRLSVVSPRALRLAVPPWLLRC